MYDFGEESEEVVKNKTLQAHYEAVAKAVMGEEVYAMGFDCDTCPYWDTCGGNVYDCPLMFGDGHPDDYGNN